MHIVAILPCRGRKEQTLECVRRLLFTAGIPHGESWKMILVGGKEDADIVESVAAETGVYGLVESEEHLTYWLALSCATEEYPATHYICLANDLLPVVHWLAKAVKKMNHSFPDQNCVIGFNGDGHDEPHSCHFMISKSMLDTLGGWPVWYSHNFGDTEICCRANEMGRYAKAAYAILFHNHPWISAQKDDSIYEQGRRNFKTDEMLFLARRNAKWIS
jgi:hypothetical protein